MQAVRVHPEGVLQFERVPAPRPAADDVLVEVRAAGVNRRDLLVRQGFYSFPLPLVLGSDGAGVRADTGQEVVILPSLHWGADEAASGPDFQILGGPRDGTYAELVAVPAANVYPKPEHLSWEEAAAFPLAALTAYRALFVRGTLRRGETVLVLGAGSGVSTFAVQLAVQAEARVLVTSSSPEKIDRARALGASDGVLYTEPSWAVQARELSGGGVDLVLDSVGATWQDSLDAARPGGRVVVFGATRGDRVELDVRRFYFGHRSLLGTTMGSPSDFEALLALVAERAWMPVVDSVWELPAAERAHDRLLGGEHFGKLVLSTT